MSSELPNFKRYVVSFAFSNYKSSLGGMSKYIMANENALKELNVSYVYISSVKKMFKQNYLFQYFRLIVDGNYQGVFTLQHLKEYFEMLYKNKFSILEFHFHNILFTEIKHLQELVNFFPSAPILLIIHDYSTICCSFNLLTDKGCFCGPGLPPKEKCLSCKKYSLYKKNNLAIYNFLLKNKDRLKVLCPSDCAKKIRLQAYPSLQNKTFVLPEQKLDGLYVSAKKYDSNAKIKIAYVGNYSQHKGCDVWKKMVNNNLADCYEFYEFCNNGSGSEKVKNVKVTFNPSNLNAMVDELRKEQIDCVLLWSTWPETYSYTLYESYSANCFILTNKNSGNICDFVEKKKIGKVFESEDELISFLSDKERFLSEYQKKKKCINGPLYLTDNNDYLRELCMGSECTENVFSSKSSKKFIRDYIFYPIFMMLKKGDDMIKQNNTKNKIGILTFTNGCNYGQRLQNYALQEVLSKLGFFAETIKQEYNISYKHKIKEFILSLFHPFISSMYVLRTLNFAKFNKKYIKFYKNKIEYNLLSINPINKKFDYFICGSDQIWNLNSPFVDSTFFLKFADKEKRLTYAPSIASKTFSAENINKYKNYIEGIKFLSCREKSGCEFIEKITGKKCKLVLDPTMLLTKEEWELIKIKKNKHKKDYNLFIFLGKPSLDVIKKFNKKNDILINGFSTFSPEYFLGLISDAKCVYTDSYHAMVFSIIFEKQFFVSFRDGDDDMYSRFESLLDILEIKDRNFDINLSNDVEIDLIDFEKVKKNLDYYKTISLKFLKEELNIDS